LFPDAGKSDFAQVGKKNPAFHS